jgi:uncharacterized protein DUF1302
MCLDNVDVDLHFRFWGDAEQFINGPSIYEVGQGAYLRPGSARYPGDGWSARISEHEYEAEANEAYIDLRRGPFALRLGKQQVVYGEELGVQTLDQVDSLDSTKFQAFELGAPEFSDVRIGEWTAKLSYQLPDFTEVGIENSVITGFVSPDFQPDYFVGIGSQWNDEPAAFPIGDYGNLRRARNKIVYGGVASTTVYGVDLTANFYATPEHIGWFTAAPIKFPGLPPGFAPDPLQGSPSSVRAKDCLTSTSNGASRGTLSMAGLHLTPSRLSTSRALTYSTATSSISPPPILRTRRSLPGPASPTRRSSRRELAR